MVVVSFSPLTMVDKNGGQPNTKSILPKINSFLVNTFLHSGSSNTAQIHPLEPGGITNKGNTTEKPQRDLFQITETATNIDMAENVGLVGATIGVSHILQRQYKKLGEYF